MPVDLLRCEVGGRDHVGINQDQLVNAGADQILVEPRRSTVTDDYDSTVAQVGEVICTDDAPEGLFADLARRCRSEVSPRLYGHLLTMRHENLIKDLERGGHGFDAIGRTERYEWV
jgi:hypothetical protein